MNFSKFKILKYYLFLCFTSLIINNCSKNSYSSFDDQFTDFSKLFNFKQEWYLSHEAIRIANNFLLFQHSSGGWPKNIDMTKKFSEDDVNLIKQIQSNNIEHPINYITIDNGATYSQMRYLKIMFQTNGDKRFKKSFISGLDYLLNSQYKNGGWPQCFPLQNGYQDNITFNDGAMIGVIELLNDISYADIDLVDSVRLYKSFNALDKGLQLILRTQIFSNLKFTGWCAQYDPISLSPVRGRSYELESINPYVTTGIINYLMKIKNPGKEIIHSIQYAISWLKKSQINDFEIITNNNQLNNTDDAKIFSSKEQSYPLQIWARFYEIDSNLPIFSNRDGIVQYSYSKLSDERKINYEWYGKWPIHLISSKYDKWLKSIN
jgi:PelA/Pel-15E family pectate lyase